MPYKVNKKFEPQFNLLIIATILSVLIWAVSAYLPIAGYIVYPLQLFATFIHEGGHFLMPVLTGDYVRSLTVASDVSAYAWSQPGGWFSLLLMSSAGFLRTTIFNTLFCCCIRAG